MEQRHDWAKMAFTPALFKYVFTQFVPEVIMHTKSQDEEQVRGHYDRKPSLHPIPLGIVSGYLHLGGDDFYEW